MVYFAYGALGLIDVSRDFWIKEKLTLTASELAGIGVWLTLPWTVKMVFGELVDCVPILGSQRRVYIVLGALCTAAGLVTLASRRVQSPQPMHALRSTTRRIAASSRCRSRAEATEITSGSAIDRWHAHHTFVAGASSFMVRGSLGAATTFLGLPMRCCR